MEIITGHKGEGHVKSEHDAAWHRALMGSGSYILETGNNLRADVISANEIRIRDGVLSHQGYFGTVEIGTYDSLAIANGAQGVKRKDLIVCRYTKTGKVESMGLVVIQGTPSASSPATPSYNTGSISGGSSPVDFPLYVVNINGIAVESVERLADVVGIIGMIEEANTKIAEATAAMPKFIIKDFEWTAIGINSGLAPTYVYGIEQSGYTPVAIAGAELYDNRSNGKNSGWCIIQRAWIGKETLNSRLQDTMTFTIWNQHTSQQAIVRACFKVLYISNNALT